MLVSDPRTAGASSPIISFGPAVDRLREKVKDRGNVPDTFLQRAADRWNLARANYRDVANLIDNKVAGGAIMLGAFLAGLTATGVNDIGTGIIKPRKSE